MFRPDERSMRARVSPHPRGRRSTAGATTLPLHDEGTGSMSGKWMRAALFAALGVGLAVWSAGTGATAAQKGDKDKTPTISDIMVKGHKGTDAYLAKIGSAAKAGKWDDAKDAAKGLNYF